MTTKGALGRLLEYTIWANHRVLRAVATLSVDDYKRDLGSSHGGVRGTLTHTMGAEWIWLERFKGVSPNRFMDEGEFPDVIALRDRWAAIEGHRDSWYRALKEDAVSRRISYKNLKGEPFTAPLWQLIQHVVNHSSYHRGQVVTMLRQLGAKAPATDLVVWDREYKTRAARRQALQQ
jgi:uncharacterized damage-inducible protein DinB